LKTALYPLKFVPILKEKVWGGTKLAQYFAKDGTGNIGESWELSGVEGDVSVVANGALKGKTLSQLIQAYGVQLVGKEVFNDFGNTFPLLFKFIDAREDLSVQLHPDDQLAKERHNSFGKTEMWYIMHANTDARLVLGFNRKMNQKTYQKYLSEKKLPEILHSEKVAVGDSFFIAPGTVHAIGAGVVLAEIQQTSDITYRIYDWDRPDTNGTLRELHNDLAIAAIDYKQPEAKLTHTNTENEAILLCSKPYFETNKWVLTGRVQRSVQAIKSFVVYMCVDGSAMLETHQGSIAIAKGETVLIPADINEITFVTQEATFLEVYIP